MTNFIVREGDTLCTPELTHVHTIEIIGPKTVTVRHNGERHELERHRIYAALSEGALMVLERA